MNSLDLKSAYLVVVVLNFFTPLATWLVLFHSRNRATQLWCAAGFVAAIATVLFSIPPGGTVWERAPLVVAANGLTLIGIYARVWALRDMADEVFNGSRALVMLLLVSVLVWCSLIENEWITYPTLVSLVHMGYFSYLAYEARRVGRVLSIRSAEWIFLVYGAIALLLAYGLANAWMAEHTVSFLRSSWLGFAMVLTGALSTLGVHIGFVGIVMELRRRTELRLLDEMMRSQMRTEHGQQIAHLQRQNLMGEVSSYMAHEVRQPLTTILSNAQMARHMLQQTQPQFSDLDRIMGAIVQAVNRIDSLMQRLSRYGRSSARQVCQFSLTDVVRDTVEMMEGHARQQKVKLHVAAPASHIMVEGDPMELSQVLLNLMRNAIDACASLSEGGRVDLNVHLQGDHVVLKVQDNGPGFDPTALAQAGQAFFTTKPDGVGLGLSISRDLSAMNRAELSWSNAARGACVELSWPVVRI